MGTHVRLLVAGQLARGDEVGVVVADRGPLAADLETIGAQVWAVDLRREMLAPVADARAARRLVEVIRGRSWDVVHTHDSRAGVLGRPVARALRVPVVHSAHSFAHLTQGHRGRGPARYWLTWGIERALAPLAAAIIVPSAGFGEEAIASRVVARSRVHVVHNGYDPPAPAAPDPELAGLAAQAPLVGFLSRLVDVKDPLGLVEALARVEYEFRAALVGEGEQAEQVQARVTELGLDRRVVVRPFRGPGPALAAFDIYVLPSVLESFGIGLLEGMGAGLPCVGTRVGGIPEIIEDGVTGFVVEPSDPVGLAAALDRLLREPDLRRRMGEAGRERARRFSVAAMVERTAEVYRRALQR